MDELHVNDIRCYAYHGCIEEERSVGGHFSVNVSVYGNWALAAESDYLSDAIDYVYLSRVVKQIMDIPVNLIEKAAYAIANQIRSDHPNLDRISIRITKVRAPIEQDVAEVAVVVTI